MPEDFIVRPFPKNEGCPKCKRNDFGHLQYHREGGIDCRGDVRICTREAPGSLDDAPDHMLVTCGECGYTERKDFSEDHL